MLSLGFKRFVDLTSIEFKLRDQGTFLGFFWTLINPLLSFLILYCLFSNSLGASSKTFGIYLIIGLILWNLFATSTSYGASAIFRRGQYLRSSPVTPTIVIAAGIGSVVLSAILESIVMFIAFYFFDSSFVITAVGCLWYLFGLIAIALVSFCIACLLSIASIYFYDTSYLWNLALKIGFFITPIFYTIESIPNRYRWMIELNPVSYIISIARAGFIGSSINLTQLWFFISLIIFSSIICCYINHILRYQFNEI